CATKLGQYYFDYW
nr:immunoglobulin heavy chain junction region [Mus musculus]